MRKTFTTVSVVLFAMALAFSPVAGQDYEGAIKSLAQLDSTIEVIKQQLNAQGRSSKLLASVDGDAIVDENDMLYSLVDNLQIVSQELQVALGDAQRVATAQPKNPAGVGHGKIAFSGFVHGQYYNQQGDNEQSTFRSKRACLAIKGKINEYANIVIMGQFAGSPKLLDGLLTLSPNKYWAFSFGQYKPPFGTEFLRSTTAWPFVNTSKAKALGTGRDIGASVTYKNKVNKDLTVKFSGGLFNGSGINTSDVNTDKNFVGRAEFQWAKAFTVAANTIVGKTNDTASAKRDLNTYGGSVTWNWKNEIVESEYIYSEVGNTKKAGWHIWAGHLFVTNARFLPEVQLVARYEQLDTDLDVGNNKVDRITIGTNLYIDKKYTKIQFNYQINGEEDTSIDNNEFWANFQVAF